MFDEILEHSQFGSLKPRKFKNQRRFNKVLASTQRTNSRYQRLITTENAQIKVRHEQSLTNYKEKNLDNICLKV